MKKNIKKLNFFSDKQWRSLEHLKSIVDENKHQGKILDPLITSVDRLIEIKIVTQSVLSALHTYHVKNESEIKIIQQELTNLRGILIDVANEFEATADEVSLVSRNIKLEVNMLDFISVKEDEKEEEEEEEEKKPTLSRQKSVDYEVKNNQFKLEDMNYSSSIFKRSGTDKLNKGIINKKITPIRPVKDLKTTTKNFVLPGHEEFKEFILKEKNSNNDSGLALDKLTEVEILDFDSLLSLVHNSGIRVEDLRERNKGVFISLDKVPDVEIQNAIKKLVKLGAKVWPGKKYLQD